MEWIENGITYNATSTAILMARYDGRSPWYVTEETISTAAQREAFAQLGEYFGAWRVEVRVGTVKPMLADGGFTFCRAADGTYMVRSMVTRGEA